MNISYCYYGPTGIHFIRQTDTLSFILHYSSSSFLDFFKPGNLNLNIGGGHASCEFPIFYFLYGQLFKYLGVNFFLVRLGSLLISCSAIYLTIKTIIKISNFPILQIFVLFLILSSSIYRYYSSNFLPDSIALGLSLISCSFCLEYIFSLEKNKKKLNSFLIFGLLATLIKLYYGIYFGTLLLTIFLNKDINNKKLIKYCIIYFLFVMGWYSYSYFYNVKFNTSYYLTAAKPIWNISFNDTKLILLLTYDYWKDRIYFPSTFHILLIFILLPLFIIKMLDLKIVKLLVLILIGAIVYTVVFFGQFKDHDYYFMVYIPFFLILTLFINESIQQNFPNYFKIIFNLSYIIITILSINYSTVQVNRRYNELDQFSNIQYKLKQVINHFRIIDSTSKILVIGDNTPNASLVLFNRYGYIYPDFTDNSEILKKFELVKYLVIISPSINKTPENIKEKLTNLQKFEFKEAQVYQFN
jgi:hypothetical protein